MIDHLAARLGIPASGVVALLVLLVLQLSIQLYALVDLARRSRVRGDRKWVWALVIGLGNLLGAIVYLAVAREGGAAVPDDSPADAPRADAARRALDELYGSGNDRRRR